MAIFSYLPNYHHNVFICVLMRIFINTFLQYSYVTNAHKTADGAPKPAAQKPESLFRRTIRKIGNASRALAFAGALPLLAAVSAGCEKDDCYSYNETTIEINRPTDGRTASPQELERPPSSPLIDEPVIDFVNETHAISSAGMPDSTMITLVPKECSGAGAYACSGDPFSDRGAYFMEPIFPTAEAVLEALNITDAMQMSATKLTTIQILFHEIGHLQPGGMGNEVISELNQYEQVLMGNVVFLKQGMDPARWHSNYPGLSTTLFYLIPSHFASVNPENPHYSQYDRADIFQALALISADGDYAEVRRRAGGSGIDSEIRTMVEAYLSRVSGSTQNETNITADIALKLEMALIRGLNRKFGPEIAMGYAKTLSHRLIGQGTSFTLGLEGMGCAMMDRPRPGHSPRPAPSTGCSDLGPVEFSLYSPSERICCIGAENTDGEIRFRKFVLEIASESCRGNLQHGGFDFSMIDIAEIQGKAEIGAEAVCR